MATVAGGLAILVASFWLTLKVTDAPQYGATRVDFDLALAADGFTLSNSIIGSIDGIQRDPGGRLQLTGWAFDKELAPQPVAVLVLVGKRFQQIAVTSGSRPDVTASLKESPEQTRNVAFTGLTSQRVDCGPHTVVAVNQNKHLTVLSADLMVPHCAS